jgi:heme-degrading monooxygenase HmoA
MEQATITAQAPVVTLINVFAVDPKEQQHLVELWQRAADELMRHLPGFVSASIHRSLDGTKVVNYAQWRSEESFRSMLTDQAAGERLRALNELASPVPVLCEVISVHKPA